MSNNSKLNPLGITPATIIWQDKLKDVPLWLLDNNNRVEGSEHYYQQKLKDVLGVEIGNVKRLFTCQLMGVLFTYHINFNAFVNPKKDFHWSIHIWDCTGSTTICTYRQDAVDKETDKMNPDIFGKIIEDCHDFIRGNQKCSGCNEKVPKHLIAGRYFAGMYCQKCWDGKYKAIEAKENYN